MNLLSVGVPLTSNRWGQCGWGCGVALIALVVFGRGKLWCCGVDSERHSHFSISTDHHINNSNLPSSTTSYCGRRMEWWGNTRLAHDPTTVLHTFTAGSSCLFIFRKFTNRASQHVSLLAMPHLHPCRHRKSISPACCCSLHTIFLFSLLSFSILPACCDGKRRFSHEREY